MGSASGITLHRSPITTNGGEFDNPIYDPYVSPGGGAAGLHARLEFIPNDLVEAPSGQIALVQTATVVGNQVPSRGALRPELDQSETNVHKWDPDQGQVLVDGGAPGVETSIDQYAHSDKGRNDANRSPLFGVGYSSEDGATDLSQGKPSVGDTKRGDHVRQADGTLDPPTPAILDDWAQQTVDASGQMHDATFEVAALVTGGPMADTYLGTVEWGWSSVDFNVTPKPLRLVSPGTPTETFMSAARAWNEAEFTEKDPKSGNESKVGTIDLPVTSLPSSAQAAVEQSTVDLIANLNRVTQEMDGLSGADATNRRFEKRALEAELARREFAVTVYCHQLQDSGNAAKPAEDEVSLTLSNGRVILNSDSYTMTVGIGHAFTFSAEDFTPFDAPLQIVLNEHDRAGTRSRAGDDTIMNVTWASPFEAQAGNTAKNGNYSVAVRFTR